MIFIQIFAAFVEFFKPMFSSTLPDNEYMDYLLSEPGLLEKHEEIWENK